MSDLVIDSSFLIAVLDEHDALHQNARKLEESLPVNIPRIYLDVVVVETVSVFARRTEERKRKESFTHLLESLAALLPPSKITWITPLVPSYYDDVLRMMVEHSAALNFFDALIALYMVNNHHRFLTSFDSDFDILPGIQRISSLHDVKNYLR